MIPNRSWSRIAEELYAPFSLANLCALNLWQDLQRLRQPFVDYYRPGPQDRTLAAGTVMAVALLGLAFLVIKQAASRLRPRRLQRIAGAVFIASFLFPASLLLYVISSADLAPVRAQQLQAGVFAVMAGAILLATVYVVFEKDWPLRVATGANRIFYPLPVVLIGSVLLAPGSSPRDFAVLAPASPRGTAQARFPRRVLWLIFDEFAYAPAFASRPAGLALPELDRLRRESLFLSDAHSPATETQISLPSLIDGETYSGARITGPRSVWLERAGVQPAMWSSSQSVFRDIQNRGGKTALAGWSHPYCRILGDALTDCVAAPRAANVLLLVREFHAARIGVFHTALYLLHCQIAMLPLVPAGIAPDYVELGRAEQLSEFQSIHQAALRLAASPQLELVMVHYPIPHPLGIYNRRTGAVRADPTSTYIDNLALADRVVGELRAELERTGLWNCTALILSSDHALRPSWPSLTIGHGFDRNDPRIPFLVRLPGEHAGLEHAGRVNAIITRELILAITEGRITTLRQLDSWIGLPHNLVPKSDSP